MLSVLAMMWIVGITATHALPAVALDFSEDASASPAMDAVDAGDLQRFTVPSSVSSPKADRNLLQGLGQAWTAPITGDLRDPFGPRLAQPVAGVSSFHRGQDIGGPCGLPIRAAAAGTVVQSGYYGTYGNWVLIDNGNGVQTGYAHASARFVQPGQRVSSGQVIAAVGTTGASSGCHLHLEVHVGGAAVDPVAFLGQRGVTVG